MSRFLVMAGLVAACGTDHPTHARFAVRGTVTGLDGETATLLIDNQPAATLSNGPFEVPSAVLDGSTYMLAIGGVGGQHMCFIGPETPTIGTVFGADLVITIQCFSSDTTISQVLVSVAPIIDPVFDGTHASFRTSPVGLQPISGQTVYTTLTVTVPNPSAFVLVGGIQVSSGFPSPDFALGFGDNVIAVNVSAQTGVNTNTIEITIPGVSELDLAPADALPDQEFGAAIAISQDGTTLAVGAPGGTGAVTIFTRVGLTWQLQTQLAATTPTTGARFGAAVALSVDGSRLVVGAPGETGAAGAAYVFARAAGAWTLDDRITAATPAANAAFGTSVAIDEPGTTVVAGAPKQGTGGAAFVFTHAATWTLGPTLVAAHAGDAFGTSVAISAITIAVGAPDTSSGAGVVQTFVASGATFVPEATLAASNARAGAHFGAAIALIANQLAVGSPDESSADSSPTSNTSLPGAGSGYLFTRASVWSQATYLKDETPAVAEHFGAAIALDTNTWVIVGVPGDAAFATDNGAIVAYQPGGFPLPPRHAPITTANIRFGASVAMSAGVAVGGAPGVATNAGAVYSF